MQTIFQTIKDLFSKYFHSHDQDVSLRDTLEELIENSDNEESIQPSERFLLGNILSLRDLTASDIKIPRADITAISIGATYDDVANIMLKSSHSRLPVYRKDLDDMVGFVLIKDLLSFASSPSKFSVKKIMRDPVYVAPSMKILDLLLQMRATRDHIVFVVDEFGGIDGLVTVEDVIEEIVGEIQDAHDTTQAPQLIEKKDGSLIADGRVTIAELEEKTGLTFQEEEGEDINTVAGLVSYISGRIPHRGELITHESGLEFEILDADIRRVRRVCIRGIKNVLSSVEKKSKE